MFELSVNLEYMFHEAGEALPAHIAAAAAAGFRKAEIFTTAGRDVPALAKAFANEGLELLTVVADPRTRLVDPETHAGFQDLFRRAAEDALALGCTRVVVGSGPGAPYMKRAVQMAIVADAVRLAEEIAAELGVTILIEAVNTRVDHPGVLFSRTEDSLAIVTSVASPRVRLLYDLYHSVAEGEDPVSIVPEIIDHIEHVQIADTPGRGEPGSGEIDWESVLGLLWAAGYRGAIGVECNPTKTPTAAALDYIAQLCARI